MYDNRVFFVDDSANSIDFNLPVRLIIIVVDIVDIATTSGNFLAMISRGISALLELEQCKHVSYLCISLLISLVNRYIRGCTGHESFLIYLTLHVYVYVNLSV